MGSSSRWVRAGEKTNEPFVRIIRWPHAVPAGSPPTQVTENKMDEIRDIGGRNMNRTMEMDAPASAWPAPQIGVALQVRCWMPRRADSGSIGEPNC